MNSLIVGGQQLENTRIYDLSNFNWNHNKPSGEYCFARWHICQCMACGALLILCDARSGGSTCKCMLNWIHAHRTNERTNGQSVSASVLVCWDDMHAFDIAGFGRLFAHVVANKYKLCVKAPRLAVCESKIKHSRGALNRVWTLWINVLDNLYTWRNLKSI